MDELTARALRDLMRVLGTRPFWNPLHRTTLTPHTRAVKWAGRHSGPGPECRKVSLNGPEIKICVLR